MFTIEKSLQAFDVKSANASTGEFTAYLSVFNVIDKQGDMVMPGAFTNTLQEAKQEKSVNGSMFLWPILWNHDPNSPIGGITSAVEDTKGLKVTGVIDVDTPTGSAVISGMKRGYLDSMSIGYKTVKSRMEKGTRLLLEVQLFEGSIVTFPALPNAKVLAGSVKSYDYSDKNKTEVYGMEIKANRFYGSTEIASMLGISKYLVENIIARAIHENKIYAKPLPVGYMLEGTEVACLLKQYSEQLGNTRIKLDYSSDFATKNELIVSSLRDATREDTRLDKELSEENWQYK